MIVRKQKYLKFNYCRFFRVDLWGIKNIYRKKKLKQYKRRFFINKFKKKSFIVQMLIVRLFKLYYEPQLEYRQMKKKLHYKNTTFNKFLYSLECRLDTLVYRSCLADTLQNAKFFIKSEKFTIDNSINNIYSQKLKPYSLVQVTFLNRIDLQKHFINKVKNKYYKLVIPQYLEIDLQLMSFYLLKFPKFTHITFPVILPLQLIRYKLLSK
jgi:ribosomal protein S4